MARVYYDHLNAKWDPKKQSITDFVRQLKSYEALFVGPIEETYLYYQLWQQVSEEYRDKLVGKNMPKTRDEIVRSIERIDIDKKRDRSKSDANAPPESKRPRQDKPRSSNRGDQGRIHGADKQNKAETPKPPNKRQHNTAKTCHYCKLVGHVEVDYYKKKRADTKASSASTDRNRIAAAATTSDSTLGNDQAPQQTSQGRRRKD